MTWVGAFGILICLTALFWAFAERNNRRVGIFFLILILHVAAAVIYYYYSQVRNNDSYQYYADPYKFYGERVQPGTTFVIWIVQSLRGMIGGTYLDYFLLFQAFGFFGITLVARTIEEICQELDVEQPALLFVILFLPGTVFWTSTVGKDAPLFLACALMVWSVMRVGERWYWFAVALLIMGSIRPHIALLAVGALAVTLLFDKRTKPMLKIALSLGAVGALAVLASTLQATLNVDVTSAESIANFVTTRQEIGEVVYGGGDLSSAPFAVKLFSLLFRPFFIDSSGIFGIIASVQNLFMIFAAWVLLRNWRILAALTRQTTIVRFSLLFMIMLFGLLALVYYNVGLGLRQREMATPALIVVFSVVYLVAKLRQQSAGQDRAIRAKPVDNRVRQFG